MRKLSILVGLLCFISTLSFVQTTHAQSKDSDSLYDQLRALFEDDVISFGSLLQSQGEVHWDPESPGENTFRFATARFKLYGNLDDHFSYVLQTDFTNSLALLDANIRYTTDHFALTAGAQKPGISAEFLTPASSTDLVNRSRVVTSLVNRRDVGLLSRLSVSPSFYVLGGIFNGTNQNLENNNNTFYYTGRLVFNPDLGDDNELNIGVNVGLSSESGTGTGTIIGNGFFPAVTGERTIYGGDIRVESGRLLLSSELLIGALEYAPGIKDEVTGYHITGGYWVSEKAQIVLRFDHLENDENDFFTVPAEDLLLAGLNWNWTNTTSFQFNYQINPDDPAFGDHLWLAQVQVAF